MKIDNPFRGSFDPGDPRTLWFNWHGCKVAQIPAWRYMIASDNATDGFAYLNTQGQVMESTVFPSDGSDINHRGRWGHPKLPWGVGSFRIEIWRWYDRPRQRVEWVVSSIDFNPFSYYDPNYYRLRCRAEAVAYTDLTRSDQVIQIGGWQWNEYTLEYGDLGSNCRLFPCVHDALLPPGGFPFEV